MSPSNRALIELYMKGTADAPSGILDQLEHAGYISRTRTGVTVTAEGRAQAQELLGREYESADAQSGRRFDVVSKAELIAHTQGGGAW
jgi:ribosomal protein S19E (S16A)